MLRLGDQAAVYSLGGDMQQKGEGEQLW